MDRSIVIGEHIKQSNQQGITYLAVIFLVGAMGVVWAAVGVIWSTTSQREKEHELLLVGDQFRNAIGQYYEKSPGVLKKYPARLEDLLKDERHLGIRRHLRKIYNDPMTLNNQWGLVMAPEGGIMGVHSLSKKSPLKSGNFQKSDAGFSGKTQYEEWVFVYLPMPKDFNKQ